ncbi:MAG: MBL fold metallo-hydrolase, partial [Crenarchaeota archaeon]|nr:MBL fold metallo-hydrolase [Thermoproteota archaeon]
KRHNGNIERIHYDRCIDSTTVFFEVTCKEEEYNKISQALEEINYLSTLLDKLSFIKFNVYLENKAGALYDLLNYTTSAKANIAYMDFDNRRTNSSNKLTISLIVSESTAVEKLLDQLVSHYRIEIVEYDTTGQHLDDTVFYIRFAQQLRELIGKKDDKFLMHLLSEINHIVQELTNLGIEPKGAFESILEIGRTLNQTSKKGFYFDMQLIKLNNGELFCLQMPCGGNIYILSSEKEKILIDTGYGIYHDDLQRTLHTLGIRKKDLSKILLTHADADHSGSGNFFNIESCMHPETAKLLEQTNRAYGSKVEGSILEAVYTKLINIFSLYSPPKKIKKFQTVPLSKHGIFDVIDEVAVGKLKLQVLNGLGGHVTGQVYFLCEEEGLLFTADSLINFSSLSPQRERYNTLAKLLMTTVNVDPEIAKKERTALLNIAKTIDVKMEKQGKRCLICSGHGAVSIIDDKNKLTIFGKVSHFTNG